jgi:hypothetical protein
MRGNLDLELSDADKNYHGSDLYSPTVKLDEKSARTYPDQDFTKISGIKILALI